MSLLITAAAFIVALGVLIVIHELGHFAVARACDVKVLRFSVGFGKPLWSRSFGNDRTEWAVAAVPLGGYVKMLDEREGPVAEQELHRAFNRKSVWQRFAIVLAGPVANFVLAVVLYWLLFIGGVQEAKPIVAAPPPGTAAAASGLDAGELIRAVDGDAVSTWQEARWKILQAAVEKRPARLEVLNPRQELTWRTLDLTDFPINDLEGDPLGRVGLQLFRPDIPPVIGKLMAGDIAEKSGLMADDRILRINGAPVKSWQEVVQTIRRHPGKAMNIEVDRRGTRISLSLTPSAVEGPAKEGGRVGRIGAAPAIPANLTTDLAIVVRYGPVKAFEMALERTWETALFSLRMIGKMIMGEVSWRNLSGPITIADYAGQSAQLGIAPYLSFLALISISLCVLNLLPIPLLDGGHLMYYTIEIFKGSPVSERLMEWGQRVGLTLLLFLMAFAFYNDIHRALSG